MVGATLTRGGGGKRKLRGEGACADVGGDEDVLDDSGGAVIVEAGDAAGENIVAVSKTPGIRRLRVENFIAVLI